MGYKMKGFTYPGTKQSPLKRGTEKSEEEMLKYARDPANRAELEGTVTIKPSKGGVSGKKWFMANRERLLAQVKAEGSGGGSKGGGSGGGGKHGDEMHTGSGEKSAEPKTEIKTETGPAPKAPVPGEAPENKKEE